MRVAVRRMLLRPRMYRDVCHGATSPEIKKRKDEHPHEIDEVPVQARDFDDLVVPFPALAKTTPFDIEISPQNLSRNDDQEDHADGHVRTVKASGHEEASPVLLRTTLFP